MGDTSIAKKKQRDGRLTLSGVRQVFRGARNRRLRRASSLNTSRHAIQHAGRSCVYVRATQRLLTGGVSDTVEKTNAATNHGGRAVQAREKHYWISGMLATNCLTSMHTYIFISSYLHKQTKQEPLSPDTRRQHRSMPLETKKANKKTLS